RRLRRIRESVPRRRPDNVVASLYPAFLKRQVAIAGVTARRARAVRFGNGGRGISGERITASHAGHHLVAIPASARPAAVIRADRLGPGWTGKALELLEQPADG